MVCSLEVSHLDPSSELPQLTSQFIRFLVPSIKYEPPHEVSNNVVCVTSKGSDQPVHMRSLIKAFASRLNSL